VSATASRSRRFRCNQVVRTRLYRRVIGDDGEAGLRAIAKGRPDGILLDLRMPLMDGLVFLQQLRALGVARRTPVAVLTGDYFIDECVARALRELDAELYFKPIWLDDLLAVAERLLRRR
jgi:DNA-binding response OmpR family regulator